MEDFIVKPEPQCEEDKQYLAYIDNHRSNVRNAFRKHGRLICLCLSLVNFAYFKLKNRVNEHDISKYEEAEFLPYRKRFFPAEGDVVGVLDFAIAWKHHYLNNSHHWEYWLKNGKPEEMDKIAIAEMLLDWEAMGVYKKNSPLDFYNANKARMLLGKQTRQLVEFTLKKLQETNDFPYTIAKKSLNRKKFNKNSKSRRTNDRQKPKTVQNEQSKI